MAETQSHFNCLRGFIAEHTGLVCTMSSELDLQCEGYSLCKDEFLGLNYSATIWLIGLIFRGKHVHMQLQLWGQVSCL